MGGNASSQQPQLPCGKTATAVETGHLNASGACQCFNPQIGGASCTDITRVTISCTNYPENSINVDSTLKRTKILLDVPTSTLVLSLKQQLVQMFDVGEDAVRTYDFFVHPQYIVRVMKDTDPISAYLSPFATRCDKTQCTLYVGMQRRGECTTRATRAECQSGFNAVPRGENPNPYDRIPDDAKPGTYYGGAGDGDSDTVQQGMTWTCDWCGATEAESACTLTTRSGESNVTYDIVKRDASIVGGLSYECHCVPGPGGAFKTRDECKAAMRACEDDIDGKCTRCVTKKGCVACLLVGGDGLLQDCVPEKLKGGEYCNSMFKPVFGVDFPPRETNFPSICSGQDS
jgi:hypothetical protein